MKVREAWGGTGHGIAESDTNEQLNNNSGLILMVISVCVQKQSLLSFGITPPPPMPPALSPTQLDALVLITCDMCLWHVQPPC